LFFIIVEVCAENPGIIRLTARGCLLYNSSRI
jgi:hypothetical protein